MSKASKIIIGVLSVSLLCSVTAVGYMFVNQSNSKTEYETAVNAITEIDYNERQKELDRIVEEGMINIQYSASASFDGKTSTSFNVKNIDNNKHPIQFTLMDEDGNVVYKSKQIDRGYEINAIELDKELSKGTHEGKISIGYVQEGNVSSIFPITLEVR